MDKDYFKREKYLKKARPFYHDGDTIKVFSGVRRCGKTSLMAMIKDELEECGIKEENIIYINLDSRPYMKIRTAEELEETIDSRSGSLSGMKYLFIDEIQNVKNFEILINAYREEGDYSIFITGSNSYMLSGELVTKLTGRYIEIEMTTLTFDEYIEMKRFYGKQVKDNIEEELNDYIRQGGFPQAVKYDFPEAKRTYVQSVINEIFEKDIKLNRKIRKKRLFSLIQQYVINNYGQPVSVEGLAKHLNAVLKENVRKETCYRYIEQLENLKIISKCKRFDLKSRRSLNGEEKYYLSDLSFYFVNNTDNRINYGPVLENIVYQYAKSTGYKVSIGKIGKLEVDFILRSSDQNYSYVQVAMSILASEQTEEREYRSLEAIKDNWPKYLLTLDHLLQKRNGIIHENLAEFIRDKKAF